MGNLWEDGRVVLAFFVLLFICGFLLKCVIDAERAYWELVEQNENDKKIFKDGDPVKLDEFEESISN